MKNRQTRKCTHFHSSPISKYSHCGFYEKITVPECFYFCHFPKYESISVISRMLIGSNYSTSCPEKDVCMRSRLNLALVKVRWKWDSAKRYMCNLTDTILFCFFLEEPFNDSIVSDDEDEEEYREVSKGFLTLFGKIFNLLERKYLCQ